MFKKVNCINCIFWEIKTEAPPRGKCHRKSPKPNSVGLRDKNQDVFQLGVWPFTGADDWCGDGYEKSEQESH